MYGAGEETLGGPAFSTRYFIGLFLPPRLMFPKGVQVGDRRRGVHHYH